jgi:hypothetical protein
MTLVFSGAPNARKTATGQARDRLPRRSTTVFFCAQPEKLQQICDSLGPEQIERLFRKWLKRIPPPLRP